MSCLHDAALAFECQAGDKDAASQSQGLHEPTILDGIPDADEQTFVFDLPEQVVSRLRRMNNAS